MHRAERWLFGQRRVLRDWRRDGHPDGVDELLERAIAGVDALHAAHVLTADEAAAWRGRLTADASTAVRLPEPGPEARASAEGLLEELLADVPTAPEWDDPRQERFEGAVELLAAAGAVDPRQWDARLRSRTGQPTAEEEDAQTRALNAGGTEVELLAVLAGPDERRAGRRVVVALRFDDGISFVIDKEPATAEIDWPDWSLTDDLGTFYFAGGSGGSDTDEHMSFRTAPPAEANWVELELDGHPQATFRIAL